MTLKYNNEGVAQTVADSDTPVTGIELSKNGDISPLDFLRLSDTSATTDEKYWGIAPGENTLYAYTINDALNSTVNWMTVVRSGTSISDIFFPNGNFYIGNDLTVDGTISGNFGGNAATATVLQTARNIGNVSFDGSANIVPQTLQTVDENSNTICFPLFANAPGSQPSGQQLKTNADIIYNPSTHQFDIVSVSTNVALNLTCAGGSARAYTQLKRLDTTGDVKHFLSTGATTNWSTGLNAGDSHFYLRDEVNSVNLLDITPGATPTATLNGNLNISGLTASRLVSTDVSNNFVSSNLTGDVTTVGLATTLATVNGTPGTFGLGSSKATFTVNAKGLITGAFDSDIPLPSGYINNLTTQFASTTTLTLSNGTARDSTNSFNILNTSADTINIAVNGVNGLDTGTKSASTWYAVFVIADSAGVNVTAGLLSLSATAPTLPSGYDKFRRVGWVRNGPGNLFKNTLQQGTANDRWYYYDDVDAAILSGGSATTYTALSCATGMSPTSQAGILRYAYDPFLAGGLAQFRPTGSTVTQATTINRVGTGALTLQVGLQNFVTDTSQSVDYLVTNGSDNLSLVIYAFNDSI